ncbi:UNKNOWN [Stylonychia lemnae]|uniref:Uncharacterized protein n=1 Tax=Stylonychia lemnae TaxID=5949 RepID=A0A078A489_STYLE|nr:UNKNOWN [Stylonychia lemnae]|eukprot:CDW77083.1 UNKNOWN [Stylonychia lemnae]
MDHLMSYYQQETTNWNSDQTCTRRLSMLSPIDMEHEEMKDDFAINIEESTNYIEPSTNQTFSPLYLKSNHPKIMQNKHHEQLQPAQKCQTEIKASPSEPGLRMSNLAQKLMMIVEKQMSLVEPNQQVNACCQNQTNKKKRGRPKKVIRDPSALHYKCRHNKSLINCFPTYATTDVESSLNYSQQNLNSINSIEKDQNTEKLKGTSNQKKLLNNYNYQSQIGLIQKRARIQNKFKPIQKKSTNKSTPNSSGTHQLSRSSHHQPKKRGRKPKPKGLIQNTLNFLGKSVTSSHGTGYTKTTVYDINPDTEADDSLSGYSSNKISSQGANNVQQVKMIVPSLKSDIYDINNMVSIGFNPSSIRRNINMDTTSWRNQSNILVPQSRQIQGLIDQQILDQNQLGIFADSKLQIFESDSEELTDDKTFLDRHERALQKLLIDSNDHHNHHGLSKASLFSNYPQHNGRQVNKNQAVSSTNEHNRKYQSSENIQEFSFQQNDSQILNHNQYSRYQSNNNEEIMSNFSFNTSEERVASNYNEEGSFTKVVDLTHTCNISQDGTQIKIQFMKIQ